MPDRERERGVKALEELALTLELLSFWGSKFIAKCFKADVNLSDSVSKSIVN
jgi:hypothetical protein